MRPVELGCLSLLPPCRCWCRAGALHGNPLPTGLGPTRGVPQPASMARVSDQEEGPGGGHGEFSDIIKSRSGKVSRETVRSCFLLYA